jgi:hypothetical protein
MINFALEIISAISFMLVLPTRLRIISFTLAIFKPRGDSAFEPNTIPLSFDSLDIS